MLHFKSAVMVKPEDPFNVDAVLDIFTNYTVSAHYLVDRDGTVYRLVPEDRTAFHAGRGRLPGPPYFENSLNDHSIGIEIMAMGSARDMLPFMSPSRHAELMAKNPHWFGYTDAQYASLRALLAEILRQFPGIAPDRMHIIGHDEYAPGRKTDPGETFDYTQLGLAQKPPADWVHPPSAD
jgi:N-acetyl-anhydromuramyl-L-alanine amidase AmpD